MDLLALDDLGGNPAWRDPTGAAFAFVVQCVQPSRSARRTSGTDENQPTAVERPTYRAFDLPLKDPGGRIRADAMWVPGGPHLRRGMRHDHCGRLPCPLLHKDGPVRHGRHAAFGRAPRLRRLVEYSPRTGREGNNLSAEAKASLRCALRDCWRSDHHGTYRCQHEPHRHLASPRWGTCRRGYGDEIDFATIIVRNQDRRSAPAVRRR